MAANYGQKTRICHKGRLNTGHNTAEDWQKVTQSKTEEDKEKQIQSEGIIENADVEFEVEGKVLKAVKVCLSMTSPVFKAMFKDDFKEKSASRIPLPGKAYADVFEFIEVTHSGNCVDDKNVEMLLPLAHEYDCKSLLTKCEQILLNKTVTFHQLALAGKYDLQKLRQKCIDELFTEDHERRSGYDRIDSSTKVEYLERKLAHVTSKFNRTSDEVRRKTEELEWMKEKYAKLKGVIKIDSSQYVCCLNQLRNNFSSYISNKVDEQHVAGSQYTSCAMCAAFKFFEMNRIIS